MNLNRIDIEYENLSERGKFLFNNMFGKLFDLVKNNLTELDENNKLVKLIISINNKNSQSHAKI
jgi:hypothetical protein